MLYEIVTVILAIYAILSPLVILKAVQFGLKCAEKPAEVMSEPVMSLPKKTKKPELTDDMRRGIDILTNIDTYDGTSNGQKEIK